MPPRKIGNVGVGDDPSVIPKNCYHKVGSIVIVMKAPRCHTEGRMTGIKLKRNDIIS